jgi:hypothetical protein
VVATAITSRRGVEALNRVREIVEEHGTDEQKKRLDRIMGGRAPAPNRAPVEHAAYQAEALCVLYELFAEHIEQAKPRPRGRPPKSKEQADGRG